MKTFKSFCYVNNHKVFLSVDGIPYRSLVHSHLSDPFRDLKICMFFPIPYLLSPHFPLLSPLLSVSGS